MGLSMALGLLVLGKGVESADLAEGVDLGRRGLPAQPNLPFGRMPARPSGDAQGGSGCTRAMSQG